MALDTERGKIAHLLRRAGFSPSAAELDAAVAKGRDAVLEELLSPERVPDPAEALYPTSEIDYARPQTLSLWWLSRMIATTRPLQEKLTLFWHGHLTSALSRVGQLRFTMVAQNEMFRAHALGNFRDLVLNATKDPAMIQWLDNNTNRKGKPNENFARELFELFTLGRDRGYSEADIREAARAFTGWFQRDGVFTFVANQHDFGPKTIFGRTGDWDGGDVIGMSVEHDATGGYIAKKLWTFFAYPDPAPAIVDAIARVFYGSGFDIRAVMRAIFTHPAFYSDAAYHAVVKGPVELAVGFFRGLEAAFRTDSDPQQVLALANQLIAFQQATGQVLFNPADVEGWPGGRDWVSTTALVTRYNFAERAIRNAYPGTSFDIGGLLQRHSLTDAAAIADFFIDLMVDGDLSTQQRQTLHDYLVLNDNGTRGVFRLDEVTINKKVRGLIHLLATTPQYQLA